MQRLPKGHPFPETYFQDVEREIAKMGLRPSLQQAILHNIRRHLERLAAEKKDPKTVLGTPEEVALQVRRQLEARKRQWRARLMAWFFLFWGWALTLQGLYGLMRREVVWVTAGQLAYLVIAPVLILTLLQWSLNMGKWPQNRRRWAYVGLAAGGILLAAGAVGWLSVYGTDALQEPLFGLTPWLSVAVGTIIVLLGYRQFRRRG